MSESKPRREFDLFGIKHPIGSALRHSTLVHLYIFACTLFDQHEAEHGATFTKGRRSRQHWWITEQ